MKNLYTKIIGTVVISNLMAIVMWVVTKGVLSLIELDEQAMFFYEYLLVLATCTIVLIAVLTSEIAKIWKTKRRKNNE